MKDYLRSGYIPNSPVEYPSEVLRITSIGIDIIMVLAQGDISKLKINIFRNQVSFTFSCQAELGEFFQ